MQSNKFLFQNLLVYVHTENQAMILTLIMPIIMRKPKAMREENQGVPILRSRRAEHFGGPCFYCGEPFTNCCFLVGRVSFAFIFNLITPICSSICHLVGFYVLLHQSKNCIYYDEKIGFSTRNKPMLAFTLFLVFFFQVKIGGKFMITLQKAMVLMLFYIIMLTLCLFALKSSVSITMKFPSKPCCKLLHPFKLYTCQTFSIFSMVELMTILDN